jgi:hypothetical protein
MFGYSSYSITVVLADVRPVRNRESKLPVNLTVGFSTSGR